MKLKLDLHTHVWEAFNFAPPSVEIAEKVVAQIKSKGIDGIGITDHHNKDWAFEFRELVEKHFPGQVTSCRVGRSRFARKPTPLPNTRWPSFSFPTAVGSSARTATPAITPPRY